MRGRCDLQALRMRSIMPRGSRPGAHLARKNPIKTASWLVVAIPVSALPGNRCVALDQMWIHLSIRSGCSTSETPAKPYKATCIQNYSRTRSILSLYMGRIARAKSCFARRSRGSSCLSSLPRSILVPLSCRPAQVRIGWHASSASSDTPSRGQEYSAPVGPVCQSIYASAGQAVRPHGRLGSLNAGATTFQRGRRCAGQQACTNSMGDRDPAKR